MELAVEIISDYQTIRSETVQDLKDFNSQSLSTQAKKGDQLVSMMPAISKAFNLLGDDVVELSTILFLKFCFRNYQRKQPFFNCYNRSLAEQI